MRRLSTTYIFFYIGVVQEQIVPDKFKRNPRVNEETFCYFVIFLYHVPWLSLKTVLLGKLVMLSSPTLLKQHHKIQC